MLNFFFQNQDLKKNMGKNNANKIMHFKKKIMQYCNISLIKTNNAVLQYCIKTNHIAMILPECALIQGSGYN